MGAGQLMSGYGQGISGLLGQDINRMMGMGGLQRGMDQRALDLAYGNFVGQYNLPLQTLGQIGSMAAGFAPALGQTTLQSGQAGNTSNPLMQMLGTGMQAYGMFSGNDGSTANVMGGQGPINNPGKGAGSLISTMPNPGAMVSGPPPVPPVPPVAPDPGMMRNSIVPPPMQGIGGMAPPRPVPPQIPPRRPGLFSRMS